jgi:hypothetical protein
MFLFRNDDIMLLRADTTKFWRRCFLSLQDRIRPTGSRLNSHMQSSVLRPGSCNRTMENATNMVICIVNYKLLDVISDETPACAGMLRVVLKDLKQNRKYLAASS